MRNQIVLGNKSLYYKGDEHVLPNEWVSYTKAYHVVDDVFKNHPTTLIDHGP